MSRCWAHLSELGFGAIQRLFLSAFDYVLAYVGQRGSRSRQTGDMVYRMGMAMEGCRPWIAHGGGAAALPPLVPIPPVEVQRDVRQRTE